MNRIVRLTFTLWLLLVLAACAPALTPAAVPSVAALPTALSQSTPVPSTPVPAAQSGGVFFARPQGETGPLIAYDMATGAIRFSLPAGRLSADSQHYLAARAGAGTQLLGYDSTTGAERLIGQLTGQWELSSVSATGRWAALTRVPTESEKQAWSTANAWKTGVQVVDTNTGQIAHQLELDGNFVVDTLSAQGDSLFVIQYLPAVKPDHYQVRLFDLTTGTLQDGALVDKRDSAEVMAGQRWQAVATSDGSWLYTLYLRTSKNTAFIHALNTVNKFAMCFDLPTVTGSTQDQLKAYSIALAPNGQTIYAANPALGVVAKVDVSSFEVTSAASFAADLATLPASASGNYSVADEHGLYFTGGKQIWAFDMTTRQVKSLSTVDNFISGLALGRDGRQLLVARVDQPPVMLDTTSGAAFSSQ
jgi:hypothetical protein